MFPEQLWKKGSFQTVCFEYIVQLFYLKILYRFKKGQIRFDYCAEIIAFDVNLIGNCQFFCLSYSPSAI